MEWTKQYGMFYLNIDNSVGRGLILYIHQDLTAEVTMDSQFEENLFVKIKTCNNEHLIVGLIYRSPSENTIEKINQLRNLVSEAANMNSAHLIIWVTSTIHT